MLEIIVFLAFGRLKRKWMQEKGICEMRENGGGERERERGGGAGQTYRQRQTKINREAGTNEERQTRSII